MALITISAANQGVTALPLTQLMVPNAVIPASTTVSLTDYNFVEQILRDTELLGYINDDSVLLRVNSVTLTKGQSLAFLDAPTVPVKVSYGQSSVAPTVNDDESAGYSIGSFWVTTGGLVYFCVDATTGAAIWTNLTAGGGTDELVKVSATDTTAGYLAEKLTSGGSAIVWTQVNPGGDEDLRLDIGNATNLINGFMPLTDKAFANHSFDTSWSEGGILTYGTGLNINVSSGDGFINDAADETSGTVEINWIADTVTLVANTETWIYVDSAGVVHTSTAYPDTKSIILLGRARGNATQGTFLAHDRVNLQQHRSENHDFFRSAFGGLATDGLIAAQNATTPLHIDVGAGTYWISGYERNHLAAVDITWTYWYQNGAGGWTTVPGVSAANTTQYDNGTGTLAALPTNKWKKDVIYITNNGSGSEFHMVYAQEYHNFQQAAETGDVPEPPDELLRDGARFAGVVVQQGATSITIIVDEKPLTGQKSTSSSAPSVVRSLTFPLDTNGSKNVSGEHVVVSVSSNGSANFAFAVPQDFISLVAIELIGVPSAGAAGAGKNIDLFSQYGDPISNESPSTHAETDTTSTYDFTGLSGLFAILDLSSVFNSLSANDRCGLGVDHNSIGGSIEYHEIRLVYEAAL